MPPRPPSDTPPDFSTPSPYYGEDWSGAVPRIRHLKKTTPKTQQQKQAQWMAFGLVTLALIMAITLLPRESAGVLFWGGVSLLVGGAVGVKGVQKLPSLWAMLRRDFKRLRRGYRENHAWVGFWLALLASGLMVLAANRVLPGASNTRLETGLTYFLLGIAAVVAIPLATPQQDWRLIRTELRDQSNWVLFVGGAFLLWIISEANGQLFDITLLDELSHDDQFVLLCVGLALVAFGLGGTQSLRRIRFERDVIWEWVAVLAILAVGMGIRVWRLESAVHRFVDEMNFGTVVLYFQDGENLKLLHPTIRGFPVLYAYWQHWGVDLFGRDLTALRIVSVVLGTLTIGALYLLARELFDKRTGLIAAGALAVLPPHVHHSRLGIGIISDPLFGTLALAFMARAVRTQKRLDYAISGVCLGLTHYFYEGGRLLYTPVMLTWVVIGLILWCTKPSIKGLLITAVGLIVVAAPIYYTSQSIGAPLTPRFDDVGRVNDTTPVVDDRSDWDQWETRLKEAFLVYTNRPEGPLIYYGGDRAMLLAGVIPFFLLGTAYTLRRFRSPAFLLIVWGVSTSVGNSLLNEPGISARYVVVYPAVALLVAVGLNETVKWLAPKRLPVSGQMAVLGLVVLALGAYQVDFYFGPQLTRFNEQIRTKPKDGEDALFRTRGLPLGTRIYVVGDGILDYGYAQSVMMYIQPGMIVEILSPEQLTYLYLESMSKLENAAFFLMPEDIRSLDRVRRFFTVLPAEKSPYNVPEDQQLWMYYAPAYLQHDSSPAVIGIEPQP